MTMNQKQNRDALHSSSMGAFAMRQIEGSAMATENAKQDAIAATATPQQMNRLTKRQRNAIRDWLKEFPTLIGQRTQGLADQFVQEHDTDELFSNSLVTEFNILSLAKEMGYRTLNYRLVRYAFPQGGKPEVFVPLSVEQPSPVAAVAPVAPVAPLNVLAPTAVTMYRAIDGTLHATPEEALDAGKAEEFGNFIHDNCALHPFDAKQLAASILKNYTVSAK